MATTRLRITGGSARGVPITEPRGARLRPTSGLVREAVFNIVSEEVNDATVLDLYAGTGALAIEALSRGAAHATMVEAEPGCITAILQSLARTGFSERARVLRGRLPSALKGFTDAFDIIFMDPPYGAPEGEEVLLAAGSLLTAEGLIVFEHASRYNPPERPAGLRLADRRVYGDSALAFYRRQEGE